MSERRLRRQALKRRQRALDDAEQLGAILADAVEIIGTQAAKAYTSQAKRNIRRLAVTDEPTPLIEPTDMFDNAVWDDALEQAEGFMGDKIVDEMGFVGVQARLTQPHVKAVLDRHMSGIDNYGQEMRQHLRSTLETGFDKGWSIDKTSKALQSGALSPRAATLIARTEMVGASNGANYTAHRHIAQPGDMRVWLHTPDGKTRPEHTTVNAVPFDQPFIVGGEEAFYPSAPELSISMRGNCRCTWYMREAE